MHLEAFFSISTAVVMWLIYLTFQLIYNVLRNIKWLFDGTYSELRKSRKPENYATSAHLMKIIFKYRVDEFIETRLSDFGLVHTSFVTPEYVLKDNVYIMQITPNEVVFVEIRPGSRPIEDFNFVILGIHNDPINIITMPWHSFDRLVDTMEHTDAKIVFLQNQARCGSTLFMETLKATGRCIVFNELHVMNALCKFHYIEKRWNREEAIKNIRNVIRMVCKPRHDQPQKVLAYAIKPAALTIMCAELIPEALPDSVQFFMYRDPIKVGISIRRLAEAIVSVRMMFYIPNIPNMSAPLIRQDGYCDIDYRGWTPKTGMNIEWGFRMAAVTMMRYLRYREKGVVMHGLRYEILRDHREKIVEQILELCGMPKSLVPKAMEAFKKDSQGESPVSRAILTKLNPVDPVATPEITEECRLMCKALNVPELKVWSDESYCLPGSVTP